MKTIKSLMLYVACISLGLISCKQQLSSFEQSVSYKLISIDSTNNTGKFIDNSGIAKLYSLEKCEFNIEDGSGVKLNETYISVIVSDVNGNNTIHLILTK